MQVLGIIALATAFTVAEETVKPPKGGKAFKKLDTDKSGSLSLEEFLAAPKAKKNPERANKVFKKIDADSSGEVTPEEFKAHKPGGGGKRKKGGDDAPAAE